MEAPFQNAASLRLLVKQRTWVLALVPRGSQLTTSKRPPPHLSISAPRPCTRPTPVSPGPPGLMNSVPIRSSGTLARWRITARLMVRPSGRPQSSGTRIRAHSSPAPGGSHGPQAIGAPTALAALADPGPAATASPAESATKPTAARTAARTTILRGAPATDAVIDEFVEIPSGAAAGPASRLDP